MAEKLPERSELSSFNLKNLETAKGLRDFAQVATKAKKTDLESWAKKTISSSTQLNLPGTIARSGVMTNGDYLHARMGMIPLPKEDINSTTIAKLKQLAETGKITTIPYTTQTKGKEVQQVRTVEKPLSQTEARTYLLQFTDGKGEISKSGRVAWAKLDFDTRTKLQRSVNAYADGKIGRDTIDALKARTDGKEYQTTLKLDNLKQQIAGTEKTMQDLQSAGIQVGEASTTAPSSETTTSTVADTKTTTSETFIDTPEKQATRKLMEEAEAVRIAKLQVGNNTQTKTPIQETSSGDEYDDLRNSPANMTPEQASKVEAATTWTPPRATTPETTTTTQAPQAAKREVSTNDSFSSLNEKYDKGLNEVVETFDPSKYTYINFSYDVASEDGKKSEKITEVVRIDNKAFGAAGINKDELKGQNAYKLMHIIRLGSQSMPDWFQNINDIKSDAIPAGLTGEKRVDFVNTVLSKKQKDPIKLNILTDANKYLGSISKTATLGLWTAGKEGVKDDARKSDMKAMQEEFARSSKKLVESNSSENLSKYYTKLVTNADNIQELSNLAKNDPILRDILKEFELDVSVMKTGSFGSFIDGSKLKAIQKEITSGRREEFAGIVDTKIKARGAEAFIFREGQFQFSDTALQAATSSNGNGILKGNTLNEKGESTDIYLTANKLDQTRNIPGITPEIINKGRGKVVPIKDFEGLDNAQLYISQSGDLYLINSPKHIGALSQMLTTAGDRLSGETAEKVYIAVGASLLTLAATGNLSGLSLGTPHMPRVGGQGITTQSPEWSANLGNAATGYVATAVFLYADIAKLEGQVRDNNQMKPANGDLYKMALAHGGDAVEKFKQAALASINIPTTETK